MSRRARKGVAVASEPTGAGLPITLNGEPDAVPPGTTVAALLARLGRQTGRVAVEVNAEVVPRATYATRALAAGDRVEIVTFVGGG